MAISPRKLRELGVIGMNDRNINLIAQYNPRHLYPLVDNKLQTKLLATEKNVATPGLISALKTQQSLNGSIARCTNKTLSPFITNTPAQALECW